MNIPLNNNQQGYPQDNAYGSQQPGQPGDKGQVFGSFGRKIGLDKSAHPIACFFTFAFKGLAAALYIFFSWIMDDYVNCIVTVIFSALDFWVVKNVSGRLLVGLRWKSLIQEDGTEKWIFESKEDEYEANGADKFFFWTSQYIAVIFWGVLLVLSILGLSFSWAVIKLISFILVGTNLYCFYKCSKDQKEKLASFRGQVGNQLAQRALNQAVNQSFK